MPPVPDTGRGSRVPPAVVIGGIVLLLALLGGGGLLLSQKNNQDSSNATGTQAQNTQIAFVLSETATPTKTPTDTSTPVNTSTFTLTYTPTATLTPSHTNTPTPTFTPSNTPLPTSTHTPLPTETPNSTLTALAQNMGTVAAFQTQIVQATQTAVKAATNAQINNAANATATAVANATATQAAIDFNTTVTAGSENSDATGTAIALSLVPPTDTPLVSGDTPVPGPDAPDSVIPDLANNGFLTSTAGQQVLSLANFDVTTSSANNYRWRIPDGPTPMGDFVMFADVSWDQAHSDDGCGFLFRFTQTGTSKYTFHGVYLTPAGHVLALTAATGKTDVTITNTFSPLIDTGASAENKMLLIGQGNNYRVYVDTSDGWKRVASFSPKTHLDDGSVTISAVTGNSIGLTCHFANAWAWQLSNGSAGNGTPQVDLPTGLTSNDPNLVITALEQAQVIPAGVAQQVKQDASEVLKLTTFAKGQGGQFVRLIDTPVTNFVLSVDLTMSISEKNSVCGVYYDATNAPESWVAIFLQQDKSYAINIRKNNQWSSGAETSGNSDLIQIGKTPQRLTVIVENSQGAVYLDGQQAFTFEDHTFDGTGGGGIGYYMEKTASDSTPETCTYTKATLWQLP